MTTPQFNLRGSATHTDPATANTARIVAEGRKHQPHFAHGDTSASSETSTERTVHAYACDRCCGSGKTPYTHIDAGRCFKCQGRGTLPYDPQVYGDGDNDMPEPDYDAHVAEQERRFWENYDGAQGEADRQRFWEENGFEAS